MFVPLVIINVYWIFSSFRKLLQVWPLCLKKNSKNIDLCCLFETNFPKLHFFRILEQLWPYWRQEQLVIRELKSLLPHLFWETPVWWPLQYGQKVVAKSGRFGIFFRLNSNSKNQNKLILFGDFLHWFLKYSIALSPNSPASLMDPLWLNGWLIC